MRHEGVFKCTMRKHDQFKSFFGLEPPSEHHGCSLAIRVLPVGGGFSNGGTRLNDDQSITGSNAILHVIRFITVVPRSPVQSSP